MAISLNSILDRKDIFVVSFDDTIEEVIFQVHGLTFHRPAELHTLYGIDLWCEWAHKWVIYPTPIGLPTSTRLIPTTALGLLAGDVMREII